MILLEDIIRCFFYHLFKLNRSFQKKDFQDIFARFALNYINTESFPITYELETLMVRKVSTYPLVLMVRKVSTSVDG